MAVTTAAPQSGASSPARFEPYIAAETQLREFSVRAIVLGTILGMIFGASSLYLVLKVGLTVSASIPVAVISITFFRVISKLLGRAGVRDATILENNIVQTAGSAGESIAFGLGVTLPAIMILGFNMQIANALLVAVLGGLLGIFMMIPLRRALIVAQHGKLKYPEGTACAEVLKAGASEESKAAASPSARREAQAQVARGVAAGTSARTIFAGFGIGLVYKTLMMSFRMWKDAPEKVFGAPLKSGSVAAEISPELLGVGYIIGPRIASVMCAGGVMAYLLLIPLIKFFGEGMTGVLAPGSVPISEMSHNEIRGAYVLYIGAGAVTAGGLVSLFRSLPIIWHGMRAGLRDVGPASAAVAKTVLRTERDLPMRTVIIGVLAIVVAIVLAPPLHMNLLGAILIVAFGFLFVTVSSRLTGEIGSSSNPISGMTVATLLLTCIIFYFVGWRGGAWYVTALSVGAIVCIAASNGGTTSQDLKTGFLVGGTPRLQQMAILIGALASALILGPILMRLNASATTYVPIADVVPGGLRTDAATLPETERIEGVQAAADPRTFRVWHKTDTVGGPEGKYLVDDTGQAVWLVDPGINGTHPKRPDGTEVRKFDAPKATLMSYIIKGILNRELPWGLVLFGAMIALVLEMSGIPSLAFAVGVYLPISSSSPIFFGGMVRWLVDHARRKKLAHANLSEEQLVAEGDKSPGVLMASGYIAGGAIAGIVIAFTAGVLGGFDQRQVEWASRANPFYAGPMADVLSLLPFAILITLLYLVGRERILTGRR